MWEDLWESRDGLIEQRAAALDPMHLAVLHPCIYIYIWEAAIYLS